MKRRSRILDPKATPLNPGTRVVLSRRFDDPNGYLKPGTMGQVLSINEQGLVHIETPSGRRFHAPRDLIVVQKRRVLEKAAVRHEGWERYKNRVILATVVGSHAWGLAGPQSDQDVKGVFVLPFEDHAGFFKVVEEVSDPSGDAKYWEISKLIHHALNADPNTLEALWSPLIVAITPLGKTLLEHRRIFISNAIVGSFGRYALSQFKKIKKRLDSDDPGRLARPKNAYNLVRLLYSALNWIREGEPMIKAEGDIRKQLLAIKNSEVPIEQVLDRGHKLAAEVESEHERLQSLPEHPDYDAAHELLIHCRRAAAQNRLSLFTSAPRIPAPILEYPELDELEPGSNELTPNFEDIRLVIFDLDDTLFDCFGQCVMPAHYEAAEAMKLAGLNADTEELVGLRLELRASYPKAPLEQLVCSILGQEATDPICQAGQQAFFNRDPGPIEVLPGAKEVLEKLRLAGRSVVVNTRGVESTQQQKIDNLALRPLLDKVLVTSLTQSKGVGMNELRGELRPEQVLVVGDNVLDEITEARALGMYACWFSRGETRALPKFPVWTIRNLRELMAWAEQSSDTGDQ